MTTTGWVLLAIVAVLLWWAIAAYNRLVELRNRIANAFGQIDVQLKRRYDLIPNLVEVARGYLQHEASTLQAVIEARGQAQRYPELKADATMQQLSEELASTENRVGFARQAFNDQVLDFNNAAQQFPTLIVARLAGFAPAAMLASTQSDEERRAPRVQF